MMYHSMKIMEVIFLDTTKKTEVVILVLVVFIDHKLKGQQSRPFNLC